MFSNCRQVAFNRHEKSGPMKLYDATYLFTAIGFPPGGSGSYIVHKRQITVTYVRRNNKNQRTQKIESKTYITMKQK
jgi:hypothetical protein